MKILYFTKYTRKGASSRLRGYQYFPYLEKQGIEIAVSPFFDDNYLGNLYAKKSTLKQVLKAYLQRFFTLWTVYKYDCLVIEYELFPYFPAWFEQLFYLFSKKYIVDYDDAIFHNYDLHPNPIIRFILKNKIDKVMKYSHCVIAGNTYLKEKAMLSGAKTIQIIPTVIDINRYYVKDTYTSSDKVVIGWIGTNSTFKYVKTIAKILKQLIEKYNIMIYIVGASESLDLGENEKHIVWSEENEVQSILLFDIGIMPLEDSDWEKGKCGYKIVQYMACAIPVVASAVGANKDIVSHGSNGFLVSELDEWRDSLEQYIRNSELRRQHGINGRFFVENKYCVQKQLGQYIDIFKNID
jgi:glycosyltransferase involved in cell wall biosynthesis